MGNNQQGPTHNALALTQPQHDPAAASKDRLDELFPIDLGEQVIGSVHEFEVPAPKNNSAIAAVGTASVHGALGMTVAWPNSTLIPSVPGGPLKFTFSPVAPGVHNGTLTLVIQWTDGHVETKTVSVMARARELTTAPHDAKVSRPASAGQAPSSASSAQPAAVRTDGLNAHTKLFLATDAL